MLDFQSVLPHLNIKSTDHPSAAYTRQERPLSQLIPQWLAKRDVASGDQYRRRGFADLYGRRHGLRQGTFLGMNGVHEVLGIQRNELFSLVTSDIPAKEDLAVKSKTYKQKAKEFYRLVKGRTKDITPRLLDFDNPYAFLGQATKSAEKFSTYPATSNLTVNVGCGTVTSSSGCTVAHEAEAVDSADEDSPDGTEHPYHARPGRYSYYRGQPFLTVNVNAPLPSLYSSSTPSTPSACCCSCPPTPATATFNRDEIRVPGLPDCEKAGSELPDPSPIEVEIEEVDDGCIAPVPTPNLEGLTLPEDSKDDELAGQQADTTTQIIHEEPEEMSPDPVAIDAAAPVARGASRSLSLLSPVSFNGVSSQLSPVQKTPPEIPRGNILGLADFSSPAVAPIDGDPHPCTPPTAPARNLDRQILIDCIRRCAGDPLVKYYSMLKALPENIVIFMLNEFHDQGVTHGLQTLEDYHKQFDGRLRQASIGVSEPGMIFEEYTGDTQVRVPSSQVDDRTQSPLSRVPAQPIRKETTDSNCTMLFNRNNSPIPRNAIAAGPSPLEASLTTIKAHLNHVQMELYGQMLSELNIVDVCSIADAFLLGGTARGLEALDDGWQRWMIGETPVIRPVIPYGDSYKENSPANSRPERSYWSPDTFNVHQQARMPSSIDEEAGETRGSPSQVAGVSQEHHALVEANRKKEAIIQWRERTVDMRASPDAVSEVPSSAALDLLENGGVRGSDNSFGHVPGVFCGQRFQPMAMWSLPGIRGGGLPAHLAAQTRIWGI